MTTRADVLELIVTMAGRWPHEAARLSQEGVQAEYLDALASVAPDLTRAALDAWYRDGQKFAPNGAQLLGKLAELAIDAPDFGEVKAAILGWRSTASTVEELAATVCPHGLCDGDGMVLDFDTNTACRCRCWPDRLAAKRARRARHPIVAEFLRHTDPREFGDLERDRIAEAQIRQKWEAFLRGITREITYQGIDPAGLPALERIASTAADRARLASRRTSHKGPRTPEFMRLVEGGGS
jgi:hypothetical protein